MFRRQSHHHLLREEDEPINSCLNRKTEGKKKDLGGFTEGVASGAVVAVVALQQLRSEESRHHTLQICGRGWSVFHIEGQCEVSEVLLGERRDR